MNLPFVIIVLLFCLSVMTGGVLSIFYLTGAFPSFNAKVEKILALTPDKNTIDTTQIDELLSPISIEGIKAAQLLPYFSLQLQDEKMPSFPLLDKGNTFSEYELEFSLFDDRYSLKCNGIFERLNPDYAGEVYPESTWEYHGEFPIISQPALFADSIVFVDAKPKLVQLDLQTGTVLTTLPSPAYPGKTAAIIDQNSYVFSGRDGKTYAFEFLNSTQIEQKTKEKNEQNTREYLEISRLLAYSEKTAATLQDMLDTWMDSSVNFNRQSPFLLSDTQNPQLIPLKIAEPLVFAYTPQEQGTYTLGLCDEKGRWITAQGFVAIFTGQGDIQSLSMDYVADKPQTTLHLSPTEFYYITVGLFPTKGSNENPDSDGESDANSYFIMVKKTS